MIVYVVFLKVEQRTNVIGLSLREIDQFYWLINYNKLILSMPIKIILDLEFINQERINLGM